MRRYLLFIALFALFLIVSTTSVKAQTTPDLPQSFMKAKVITIQKEGTKIIQKIKSPYQIIEVSILDGSEKGKNVRIESGTTTTLTDSQRVQKDETVIVTKIMTPGGKSTYHVYDTYRIQPLIFGGVLFIFVVLLLAGWKGIGSVFGLIVSLGVIIIYIIPQILSGSDPLMTSIYGSILILIVSTYLAHGISRQTTIALFSTLIALMLTAWLATIFVDLAQLTGSTEETLALQFGISKALNLKGLLLGGIIIGTLGALNDVTTTQAASVFELAKTDRRLRFDELYKRGYSIGREHVVSMVNTLVLAYAGSSLVIFLFILLNPQKVPLFVILNSEEISQEIVRTLAGSLGLVLVVPIVTFFAALACDEQVKAGVKRLFHSLK